MSSSAHWRNLLKQPFKVPSKRRKDSLCGISIFSLCSGHLIHPLCSAPPHFLSIPLPAFHTLAGIAEGDWCHQLYRARRWLWEAVQKIFNSSFRKMAWVWSDRFFLPNCCERHGYTCFHQSMYVHANFRRRYRSCQRCPGFLLSLNFHHRFSPHLCFGISCSISHTEA